MPANTMKVASAESSAKPTVVTTAISHQRVEREDLFPALAV
jgi:hypothetical protein